MAAKSEVPDVTYFALLIDDGGNPKIVMIRDPHKDEPDKPFWKLIGHTGQRHEVLCRTQGRAESRPIEKGQEK